MTDLVVRNCDDQRHSKHTQTFTPDSAAARFMAKISSHAMASGFSTMMCFPFRAAAMNCAACWFG